MRESDVGPEVNLSVEDFLAYGKLKADAHDIDPEYELFRGLFPLICADEEAAVRFSLLFVSTKNTATALSMWTHGGWPGKLTSVADLGIGVERRGLRTPAAMNRHLESLEGLWNAHGSATAWLQQGFGSDPEANWDLLTEHVRQAWNNGRWAGFKTADLLKHALDWNVEPRDAGHAFSSGPRQGLARMYGAVTGNSPSALRVLDRQTSDLRSLLRGRGVDADFAQIETLLCDFNSLADGRAYVGYDLDRCLAETVRLADGDLVKLIFGVRHEVYPRRFLGELRGWAGVRNELRGLYATTRRMEWWND